MSHVMLFQVQPGNIRSRNATQATGSIKGASSKSSALTSDDQQVSENEKKIRFGC